MVEIADGIHVRVARRAVAAVVKPEEDDEAVRTVRTVSRHGYRGPRGERRGGGRPRHRARRGGEPGGDTETPVQAQVSHIDAI